MLLVNEEKEVKIYLLNDNGEPISRTVTYTVYDEGDSSFGTGSCTAVSGVTGLYTMSFTPDAAGTWTVIFSVSNPTRNAMIHFDVGLGVENEIDTNVDTLLTRLSATRAGYLDELDFDLNARLGTPAGASLAADLLTIDNLVDDLEGRLTALRAGYLDNLSGGAVALEATVQALNDLAQSDILSDATPFAGADIGSVLTDTNELQTDWVDGGRLDLLVDAIKAQTDNLPTDPADASDIADDFDRHLTCVDFWGDTDDLVTITGASSDVDLPNVVVPALPTGATVWKVVLLFKCALIRDTSASDNAVNTATATIQVKDSAGAWGVDDVTAYDIQDNMWAVDVSTSADRGGDAFVGNLNNDDLSSEVTGAGTYNIRLEDIVADGANLELHDVAVGLRFYFY